jgi:hypothetical protein
MFVHLDPRRPDVSVPKWFVGQPQLILQVGLNMAIPIPDLKVDDAGITCTLSFNRSPFWCRIPWTAVYALVGEDGRGGVWAEDVPPEIQIQKKGRPSKPAAPKRSKPTLSPVRGADRGGQGEPRRGETSVADAAAPDASERSGGPFPDAGQEGQEADAPIASVSPRTAENTPDESATERVSPGPTTDARPGKKAKREIPPYLRVIK